MTRGRHRQPSSGPAMLPLAAVGALAASAAVLVFTTSDPLVLRVALVGAILVAVGLLAQVRHREADNARAMNVETSARRREESLFQAELDALRENLAALTAQIARLRIDASGLRAEIGTLREEKADAEESVRRLRAARAYRPAPQFPLTPAAFEAANEALSALAGPSGDEEESFGDLMEYISTSLSTDFIDLTPHDDTLPIDLAAVRGA